MAQAVIDSAELLRRLATVRDGEAWSELIERYGRDVYRITRRILLDEALAEDACQETLLKVREHAGKFVLPAGTALADEAVRRWFVRIAANTALMQLRKRRFQPRNEGEARMIPAQSNDSTPSPAESAQKTEMLRHIQQELAALPEVLRSAVLLRFFAQLDYKELARELRCPVGTAKARVSRGLERLRQRAVAGGLMLSIAALEKLLELPATQGALDPARLANWKALFNSPRMPALHGLPVRPDSSIVKVVLVGAALVLAGFAIVMHHPGSVAISNFIHSSGPLAASQQQDARGGVTANTPAADATEGAQAHPTANSGKDALLDDKFGIAPIGKAPSEKLMPMEPNSQIDADKAAMPRAARSYPSTDLNRTLRDIAGGKPAPADFVCVLMFSNGVLPTPLHVGDEIPDSYSIRISAGKAVISTDVVLKKVPTEPGGKDYVSIFTGKQTVATLSSDEMRELTGLLSAAGMSDRPVPAGMDRTNWIHVAVECSGKSGSVSLGLTTSAGAKNLLDLMHAWHKRAVEK